MKVQTLLRRPGKQQLVNIWEGPLPRYSERFPKILLHSVCLPLVVCCDNVSVVSGLG